MTAPADSCSSERAPTDPLPSMRSLSGPAVVCLSRPLLRWRYACRRSAAMPLAKVLSCAVVGLQGRLVEVEVDLGGNASVPAFIIVGLPDAAVKESAERVR